MDDLKWLAAVAILTLLSLLYIALLGSGGKESGS
jgi:hypothetical protein